jgi:hypothetical protein
MVELMTVRLADLVNAKIEAMASLCKEKGHRTPGGLSLWGGKQPRPMLQDAAHNPTTGTLSAH